MMIWTTMNSLTTQIGLKPLSRSNQGNDPLSIYPIQLRIGGTRVQQPKNTVQAEKIGSHLYNNLLLEGNL